MNVLERNWVAVTTANTIYAGIVDRAEFDKIDSPMIDHRNAAEPQNRRAVLTKTVGDFSLGTAVVFQHWVA